MRIVGQNENPDCPRIRDGARVDAAGGRPIMTDLQQNIPIELEPAATQSLPLPAAKSPLSRPILGIVTLCLILLAACWGAVFHILQDRRESDLELARTTVGNLAIAFEQNAYRTIRQIDQSASMLAEAFAEHPERFADDVQQLTERLRDDIVFQVAIVSPDGYLIYSNLLRSGERIFLGDREHVRFQLESPDDRLFISKPLLGRISKKWSIQFSRKVLDRQGGLIAVIVLSVEPSYFTNLYHRIDIGRNGVITLVGLDRVIRARHPEMANGVETLNTMAPYRSFYENPDDRSGTFITLSQVDDTWRIGAYRKIDHFPLAVIVLLSVDEALVRYRQLQEMLIAAAIVTSLGIVAAGLQIGRGAVRKARHYRELHNAHRMLVAKSRALIHAAATDPLCDIPNRRAFMDMAEKEFERAKRYGRPLSVILFDIDHFKSVNDRFGHSAGDRVLQSVTACCLGQLRTNDRIGRLGGEEFAVILPETAEEGALTVAERMRKALDHRMVEFGNVVLSVTASFGIAVRVETDNSVDALLQRADMASYRAKSSGRNRVCAMGEATEEGENTIGDEAAGNERVGNETASELHG